MKTHLLTAISCVALCVAYYAATAWDFLFDHQQFRRDLDSIND